MGYHKQHLNYGCKEFAFKNVIKCGCCGVHISCYNRTKTNKGDGRVHQYTYLRCAGKANKKKGYCCTSKEIREEVALVQVMDKLKAIRIPQQLLGVVLERLSASSQQEQKLQQEERLSAVRRLENIIKERGIWVSKEVSGLVDAKTVNEKLQSLNEEEARLKEKLNAEQTNPSETAWTMARVLNLASRLPELFKSSQPEQKRKILKLVFANLLMKGKNLEIFYKKPFSLLAEGSKCFVWGTLLDKFYNYLAFGVHVVPWHKEEKVVV